MLSKIAGYVDSIKVLEEKQSMTAMRELSSAFGRVNAIDAYTKSSAYEENLAQFLTKQEMEDVKKILNKPTGEGFDKLFKQECEKLRQKDANRRR